MTDHPTIRAPRPLKTWREAREAWERAYIRLALRRCRGNVSQVARLLKMNRKNAYEIMRRTGTDPTAYRRRLA